MREVDRFVEAQADIYEIALEEIKNGCKEGHWMWFVFPQLKGLGKSLMADYYGIQGREEALAYLMHPLLGTRLREISRQLLQLTSNDAEEILGWPDNLKLRSSMSLFYLVSGDDIFRKVLEKFFSGTIDEATKKCWKQKKVRRCRKI